MDEDSGDEREMVDEDLLGIVYLLMGRFGISSDDAIRLAQDLLDAASAIAKAEMDPDGE